jgi:hypothetical protein
MKAVEALYTQQIADGIRARHLATPMEEACSLQLGQSASSALRELEERQFDRAPVLQDGVVVGVVSLSELRRQGSVAEYVHHLETGLLVAADVGLRELMRYLRDEPFLLVLEGRLISGLVTATDLGRPAGRTYFYLLLSQLEIALADVVRYRFPEQRLALALLSDNRRAKHSELIVQLRQRDDFIDDVAALALVDLLTVVGKKRDLAHHFTGNWTWTALTSGMGSFRNDVMHPAKDFHKASNRGIRELIDYDSRLRHLIEGASRCLDPRSKNRMSATVKDVPVKT